MVLYLSLSGGLINSGLGSNSIPVSIAIIVVSRLFMIGFDKFLFLFSNFSFLLIMSKFWIIIYTWLTDLWIESYFGLTKAEQYSLLIGIKLLIIGEAMLFLVCFWLLINIRYNCNTFSIYISFPLLSNYPFSIAWSNALILQLSSLSIQSAAIFIRCNSLIYTIESLGQSLLSSFLFINLQQSEMLYSYYTLTLTNVGSIFYLTTGLHGLHVLFGSFGFFIIIYLL